MRIRSVDAFGIGAKREAAMSFFDGCSVRLLLSSPTPGTFRPGGFRFVGRLLLRSSISSVSCRRSDDGVVVLVLQTYFGKVNLRTVMPLRGAVCRFIVGTTISCMYDFMHDNHGVVPPIHTRAK